MIFHYHWLNYLNIKKNFYKCRYIKINVLSITCFIRIMNKLLYLIYNKVILSYIINIIFML